MIIKMITLYMIICSCETLTMPPATDHKNIIGSIVKVESASTILMMKMMSEKLGSKGLIISGSQNFGLLTECYNSDNICQINTHFLMVKIHLANFVVILRNLPRQIAV